MIKKIMIVFLTGLAVACFVSPLNAQEGDSENGAVLYQEKCAVCHGDNGEGIIGPSLVGCSRCDSEEALFEKIDADMPSTNPSDCVDQCARDIAAYIFQVFNGDSSTTTSTSPIPCPAEAIYGEDSGETALLRDFRDTFLVNSVAGQKIMQLYYKLAPALIPVIEENEQVKAVLKTALDAMLPLLEAQE